MNDHAQRVRILRGGLCSLVHGRMFVLHQQVKVYALRVWNMAESLSLANEKSLQIIGHNCCFDRFMGTPTLRSSLLIRLCISEILADGFATSRLRMILLLVSVVKAMSICAEELLVLLDKKPVEVNEEVV